MGLWLSFVGGQTFNWLIGQKAQPQPLLHSLSQLKRSTVYTPSGQEETLWCLTVITFDKWQTFCFFRRVSERLTRIIISSERRSQWAAFIFSYQRGFVVLAGWNSGSVLSLVSGRSLLSDAASSAWDHCYSPGKIKVTSVWLSGRRPSFPRGRLRHTLTERLTDRQAEWLPGKQTYRETEGQTGVPKVAPRQRRRRNYCSREGGLWPHWATADVTAC